MGRRSRPAHRRQAGPDRAARYLSLGQGPASPPTSTLASAGPWSRADRRSTIGTSIAGGGREREERDMSSMTIKRPTATTLAAVALAVAGGVPAASARVANGVPPGGWPDM